MSEDCPVCQQPTKSFIKSGLWYSLSCPNCGDYTIDDDAIYDLPSLIKNAPKKVALISHAIRLRGINSQIKVTSDSLREFILGSLPSVTEQAENLLIHFAQTSKEPGNIIEIDPPERWIGRTGALTGTGIKSLLDYLCDNCFLRVPRPTVACEYVMTVQGWQHYEDLLKQSKDSTQAFMAMKFGEPELDTIVDDTFRSAVAQTGFRLQKLNDEQSAGLIDDQLRVQIRRSRFLIADLTHGNKGAYWEAGFAEGIGIPVIYTCKESEFGKESHFDTNHHLTVMWNPDNPKEAAEKLKATIRATLPEVAKMEDN